MEFYIILIALPLVIRHSHHFLATRHASRRMHKQGMASVVVWFVSYLILMTGMFLQLYQSVGAAWNFWFGCGLLWAASIGRVVSIHQLGKAFSEFIRIEPRQRLVETGIYAYVRHPLHYFLMLEMISMSMITNRLWSWSFIGLALITLILRELHEEQALEQAFGDAYRNYRKRAAALVDFIYCIKNTHTRER